MNGEPNIGQQIAELIHEMRRQATQHVLRVAKQINIVPLSRQLNRFVGIRTNHRFRVISVGILARPDSRETTSR